MSPKQLIALVFGVGCLIIDQVNFCLYRLGTNCTLNEAEIELHRFSQKCLVKKRLNGITCRFKLECIIYIRNVFRCSST